MIDFTKKMGISSVEKKIHPVELYESLDRKSEVGPLRPSQIKVLNEWFTSRKDDKNLIIKLNTGEGKTLIGLLILQSKINAKDGPCMYICPNINLYEQTKNEAERFGIPYCVVDSTHDIPDEFTSGEKLLITYVQKVFNGLSKFGIGNDHIKANNIVLDDSHACIDSIKDSFTIKIKNDHKLYSELLSLFEEDLIQQGEGTYLEIKENEYSSMLPISYWSWADKKSAVTQLLMKYRQDLEIKFSWPIIKDIIDKCQAFVSGHHFEISPIHIPMHKFGTFYNAKQRLLMSATTQEDSFFIKGLGFDIESVKNPIVLKDVKWSGERMIVIPSLIDDELDRDTMVTYFSSSSDKRTYGQVAIVPDFKKSHQYQTQGAIVAETDNINSHLSRLRRKEFNTPLVLVNRYDGIDLPDEICRVLVIDSLPHFDSLSDRYEEYCRSTSDIINIRIAQKIEQGIGRSVRGEKDYSLVFLIGNDLVKFMKSSLTNKYFSRQTQKQIEIGLQIACFSKEGITHETNRLEIIASLIHQVLKRDEGWKIYYQNEMNKIENIETGNNLYEILNLERNAEENFFNGHYDKAIVLMQSLCDKFNSNPSEKAWYTQHLARYKYYYKRSESNDTQISAFRNNSYLLKPRDGVSYAKLQYISENRISRIQSWLKKYNTSEELMLKMESLLSDLSFGIDHDRFEEALKIIGEALGYLSQRPDKEYKTGPDNLWCGVGSSYIFFECKNEVSDDRQEISKSEAGQMNNHCGWFIDQYGPDVIVKRIMIIPTRKLSRDANFTHEVTIMRKNKLRDFKNNIRSFLKEIKLYELSDISETKLNQMLINHHLDNDSLLTSYSETYI